MLQHPANLKQSKAKCIMLLLCRHKADDESGAVQKEEHSLKRLKDICPAYLVFFEEIFIMLEAHFYHKT